MTIELVRRLHDILRKDRLVESDIDQWCDQVEEFLKSLTYQLALERTIDLVEEFPPETLEEISKLIESKIVQLLADDETLVETTDKYNLDNVSFDVHKMTPILRMAKGWLRWNLHYQYAEAKHCTKNLKTKSMLKFYLRLIQSYSLPQPTLAQHASQLLFYSTYNPVPSSDNVLQNLFVYLSEDLQLYSVLLECLLRTSSVPLALSIVRNVHNGLVSYDHAASCVEAVTIERDGSGGAPWVPSSDELNYNTVLVALLSWSLQSPWEADPIGAELVTEILRCLYVLKPPLTMTQFSQSVIRILQLQGQYESKLAVVTLLMDAPAITVLELLHKDETLLPQLLSILQKQVDDILQTARMDHGATASLTPILVVLYNICRADDGIQNDVKNQVFPPSERFDTLKEQELLLHDGRPQNMSPLDAPEGTLRHQLIQLLSWPNSHIKRFVGEFLWVLCDSHAQEFILRIGMGYGMPFLGMKGAVQLPSQILS